jgi:sigma-B regulation protein RsbU (phosphoserine phosphatase)
MMEMHEPPTATHELQPGDRVLFYTDGVTERQGPEESMYEEDRFRDSFLRVAGQSPDAIIQELVSDLDSFAKGQEAHDDQTLLLMAVG